MPKINVPQSKRTTTYAEFEAKHHRELTEVLEVLFPISPGQPQMYSLSDLLITGLPQRAPLPPWMEEVKRSPFFRLLSAASRENCPGAAGDLLYFWLARMDLRMWAG